MVGTLPTGAVEPVHAAPLVLQALVSAVLPALTSIVCSSKEPNSNNNSNISKEPNRNNSSNISSNISKELNRNNSNNIYSLLTSPCSSITSTIRHRILLIQGDHHLQGLFTSLSLDKGEKYHHCVALHRQPHWAALVICRNKSLHQS